MEIQITELFLKNKLETGKPNLLKKDKVSTSEVISEPPEMEYTISTYQEMITLNYILIQPQDPEIYLNPQKQLENVLIIHTDNILSLMTAVANLMISLQLKENTTGWKYSTIMEDLLDMQQFLLKLLQTLQPLKSGITLYQKFNNIELSPKLYTKPGLLKYLITILLSKLKLKLLMITEKLFGKELPIKKNGTNSLTVGLEIELIGLLVITGLLLQDMI